MSKTIQQALQALDTKNDEHWTADGHPRMDKLQELTGNADLTRKQVNEVAANFMRETPTLDKPDTPGTSSTTEQGATADPNPTQVGETGADEVIGDKDKGEVGDDPEHPEDPDIEQAGPDDQTDADGTVTASAENTRNEGRADEPLRHVDADGELTASRDQPERAAQPDVPLPLDADGSVTSNRQVNDEDDARRAGFEPDDTDAQVNELERVDPADVSDSEFAEIKGLDAELAELDAELAAHEEDLAERRRHAAKIAARRDALVEARDRSVDRQADMKDRMAFIKAQNAARAARAGDVRLANELAMQARGLGSSPLDQSLASRPRQVRHPASKA